MNNLMLSFSGVDLERLHTLVAAVETEVAQVSGTALQIETPGPLTALATNWSALLEMLDLGTPPQIRECLECGHRGMSVATRCELCWSRLPTLKRAAA
jgi:hypothetical protein